MFGMGFSEILVILIIGVLFLGPDKLPEAMVKIAKFFNAFKKTINEAKESIDQELKIQELKSEALEYKRRLEETTSSVKRSMYVEEIEDIKHTTTNITKTIKESVEKTTETTKNKKDDNKRIEKNTNKESSKELSKEEEKNV